MPDDIRDPRIGTVLDDRYKIVARLGVGGMGVVYQAERIGLGRPVAIKFLRAQIADKDEFLGRFEREALAMSRLHHPHCVPVIDYGVADAPYIVLEFVTGKTLTRLLDAGPLSPKRAIAIMRQVLAGLAHAHEHGIIHRDIKPDNVILTDATGTGDHAQLLDFGLAKVVAGPEASWSTASLAVGTPSYMSPEQARGEEVDHRTDIYSAGVMLFVMLTAQKPFNAPDPLEVLRMHVEWPPPKLADLAPRGRRFPADLEAAVARALAKYPRDRFPTALAFSQALASIRSLQADTQPEAVIRSTRPRRADDAAVEPARELAADTGEVRVRRGGRAFTWLFLLLLLCGAGGAAWYYYARLGGRLPWLPAADRDAGAGDVAHELAVPSRPIAEPAAAPDAAAAPAATPAQAPPPGTVTVDVAYDPAPGEDAAAKAAAPPDAAEPAAPAPTPPPAEPGPPP